MGVKLRGTDKYKTGCFLYKVTIKCRRSKFSVCLYPYRVDKCHNWQWMTIYNLIQIMRFDFIEAKANNSRQNADSCFQHCNSLCYVEGGHLELWLHFAANINHARLFQVELKLCMWVLLIFSKILSKLEDSVYFYLSIYFDWKFRGVEELVTICGEVLVDIGDVRTWNLLRRKFKSNCNLLSVCNNSFTRVTSIDTDVFWNCALKSNELTFILNHDRLP